MLSVILPKSWAPESFRLTFLVFVLTRLISQDLRERRVRRQHLDFRSGESSSDRRRTCGCGGLSGGNLRKQSANVISTITRESRVFNDVDDDCDEEEEIETVPFKAHLVRDASRTGEAAGETAGGSSDNSVEEQECGSTQFDRVVTSNTIVVKKTKTTKKLQNSSEDSAPVGVVMAARKNERRRRAEDNLAKVFMGFILVFLLCHSPRILLDIHELLTLDAANVCRKAGLKGFPAWSLVAVQSSHVLLVLNSATNILVYCGLSSKFRDEFCQVVGTGSKCGSK